MKSYSCNSCLNKESNFSKNKVFSLGFGGYGDTKWLTLYWAWLGIIHHKQKKRHMNVPVHALLNYISEDVHLILISIQHYTFEV